MTLRCVNAGLRSIFQGEIELTWGEVIDECCVHSDLNQIYLNRLFAKDNSVHLGRGLGVGDLRIMKKSGLSWNYSKIWIALWLNDRKTRIIFANRMVGKHYYSCFIIIGRNNYLNMFNNNIFLHVQRTIFNLWRVSLTIKEKGWRLVKLWTHAII